MGGSPVASRCWAKAHSPYWSLHVEAWRQSGMARADYCRQHGVSIRSWASGRLPRILWYRSILPSEVLRMCLGVLNDDQSAGCGFRGYRRQDSGRTTKDCSRRHRCNGSQSRRDDTDILRDRRR
ncbi:IS66 family insertion sequence element accessory protein TnpA [Bradyrhizobium valentinum]|uniref:IS66 family insertion sequence element accessory protein TnpA n=1 Tax=Bradyrhizobium valentinum TaxID=1518501 RepID=UPI003B84A135